MHEPAKSQYASETEFPLSPSISVPNQGGGTLAFSSDRFKLQTSPFKLP